MRYLLPLIVAVTTLFFIGFALRSLEYQPRAVILYCVVALVICVAYSYSENKRRSSDFSFIKIVQLAALGITIGIFLAGLSTGIVCYFGRAVVSQCVRIRFDIEVFVISAVASVLIEEIILRGYLRRVIVSLTSEKTVLYSVQGVIFAVIHGGFKGVSEFYLFFTFALMLTAFAEATDGLLLPIFVHAAWNAWAFSVPEWIFSGSMLSEVFVSALIAKNLVLGSLFLGLFLISMRAGMSGDFRVKT